jgi:hypothetical protein
VLDQLYAMKPKDSDMLSNHEVCNQLVFMHHNGGGLLTPDDIVKIIFKPAHKCSTFVSFSLGSCTTE